MADDFVADVRLTEAGVSKARRLPVRDVRDFVSAYRSTEVAGQGIAICVQGGTEKATIYLTPAEAEHFRLRLGHEIMLATRAS